MKYKNYLVLYITGLFLVLLCGGITYAFFTAPTQSEGASTLYAKGGTMNIKYANGSGNITLSNIYPREREWVNKTFTITGNNTTDLNMYYQVNLVIDNNSFVYKPGYDIKFAYGLSYTLTSTNTSNNGFEIPSNTEKRKIGQNSFSLGTGYFTKGSNQIHTYNLKIYFDDNDFYDNEFQEANFAAHLTIDNTNTNEIAYSGQNREVIAQFDTSSSSTYTFLVSSNQNEQMNYSVYFIPSEESTVRQANYYIRGYDSINKTLLIENSDNFSIYDKYIKLNDGTLNNSSDIHAYTLQLSKNSFINTSNKNKDYKMLPLDNYKIQQLGDVRSYTLKGKIKIVQSSKEIASLIVGKNNSNVKAPLTTPGKSISSASEAVLASTEDDYGTSYYYRGNVQNNYVMLDNYCFRIVRTTGNNNVKLVLYKSGSCDANITSANENLKTAFSDSNLKMASTGICYGTAGSLSNTTYAKLYQNDNENLIATSMFEFSWKVDLYYGDNNESILADTVWCNDKKLDTSTYEFYGKKRLSSQSPSLKCNKDNNNGNLSIYTEDTTIGNGYGITAGALTLDEIIFAGGGEIANNNMYLSDYFSSSWWTITPSHCSKTTYECNMFTFDNKVSSLLATSTTNYRPSIVISGKVPAIGSGTKEDPYVLLIYHRASE